MNIKAIKLTLIFLSISAINYAQSEIQPTKKDTTTVQKEYPYILPVWGQKVTDRNIELQLPFGLNVNYVYNQMTLDLTHFSMNFYDGSNLDEFINPETLNFTEVLATTNGVNLRTDAWILPFLNVYGIYSRTKGSTQVTFQPQTVEYDLGPNGNYKEITTLENPIELDPVFFTSNTWGLGATAVYGWDDYFVSFDGNATWSNSDLLVQTVIFFVGSGRIGRRVSFKNGMHLAFYFGAMYRDFVSQENNTGSIGVPELDAGILMALNSFIETNQERIDFWESMPDAAPGKTEKLEELNNRQDKLYDSKAKVENSNAINYSIKKEITDNWSTQIGFNFEINKHFMYRAELGYRDGQKFFMTGLQYRFGRIINKE